LGTSRRRRLPSRLELCLSLRGKQKLPQRLITIMIVLSRLDIGPNVFSVEMLLKSYENPVGMFIATRMHEAQT
jgi:hypothetical protein